MSCLHGIAEFSIANSVGYDNTVLEDIFAWYDVGLCSKYCVLTLTLDIGYVRQCQFNISIKIIQSRAWSRLLCIKLK